MWEWLKQGSQVFQQGFLVGHRLAIVWIFWVQEWSKKQGIWTVDPFIAFLRRIMKQRIWFRMSKQFLVVWPSSKVAKQTRSQGDHYVMKFDSVDYKQETHDVRNLSFERWVDTVYTIRKHKKYLLAKVIIWKKLIDTLRVTVWRWVNVRKKCIQQRSKGLLQTSFSLHLGVLLGLEIFSTVR